MFALIIYLQLWIFRIEQAAATHIK